MKQTPDGEGREMNLLEKGVKIVDIVNAFKQQRNAFQKDLHKHGHSTIMVK